jgi:hypothetical protein
MIDSFNAKADRGKQIAEAPDLPAIHSQDDDRHHRWVVLMYQIR